MTDGDQGLLGGCIRDRVHHLPVRVYYEDTDFSGLVYHANYLRYFERGRSDFLRLAGVSHRDLLELPEPVAFTLESIAVRYHRGARIDDALEVRTVYATMRGARLCARQAILRAEELIASAEVKAAAISLKGRPRRLPELASARLAALLREDLPLPGASPASPS